MTNHNSTKTKNSSGFSLIELLVTISVVAIISAIVIINHQGFRRDIELSNDAYRLALSLREAQVFGLTSRQAEGLSVDADEQFFAGYGIRLDTTDPKNYLIYADEPEGVDDPGDSLYDANSDALIETVSLSTNVEIEKICYYSGNSCIEADQADIVFYRARPTASILLNDGIGSDVARVRIFLIATSGDNRCVEVIDTGDISVLSGNECLII